MNQYAVWKNNSCFVVLHYNPGWTETESPQHGHSFFFGPCVYPEALAWAKLLAVSPEYVKSVEPYPDDLLTDDNNLEN